MDTASQKLLVLVFLNAIYGALVFVGKAPMGGLEILLASEISALGGFHAGAMVPVPGGEK
ncbi:hypothetical protein [Metallibacterium sp.]